MLSPGLTGSSWGFLVRSLSLRAMRLVATTPDLPGLGERYTMEKACPGLTRAQRRRP